jgi:outer membrane assembly lipoprotein YfiO
MSLLRLCGAAVLLVLGAACGRKQAELDPGTLDPARTRDSLWTLAVQEFDRGKWGRAQRIFERLAPALSYGDPRYLRLHFFLGETLFAQGHQLQAVREFRRVADEAPEDPIAQDALVRAGDAYADLWRRAELDPTYGDNARAIYDEVARRYPGTAAAGRAALRIAALNEKFAAKEYRNALFYFRFKAYDSAILLFRSLIATYPRTAVVPDALERLVRTYQILEYQEDVRETCNYIAQYYPDPEGPIKLCRGPGTGDRGQAAPPPPPPPAPSFPLSPVPGPLPPGRYQP